MPSQAGNRDFSPPMKIILVSTPSETAPENADALAQSNSVGDTDAEEPPLIALESKYRAKGEAREMERILLEEQAEAWLNPEAEPPAEPENVVSANERRTLVDNIDLAFLNATSSPREKFVKSSARMSSLAPYLENWRTLVERVGNINYPDAAKQQRLEGELILDVVVRSDGAVDNVRILRSSGHKILDDGAKRIVQIAGPFEPFSEEMVRDYDILHIIRTWKFSADKITDITR